MHDQHSAGGMNLLPLWVQVIGVLLTALTVAAHAVHVINMTQRQTRAWHAAHLAMGVGMLYMWAPWSGSPTNPRAWQYVFVVGAVIVGGWIAAEIQRGHGVDVQWFLALVGMVAMLYMFFVHRGHGTPALTYLAVGYFLLEAAAWARGWFGEDGCGKALLPSTIGGRDVRGPLVCRAPWDLRVAQSAMALSMAYMFLAMDADAVAFFDKAFSGSVTEQTLWASALIIGAILACIPMHPEPPGQIGAARPRTARRSTVGPKPSVADATQAAGEGRLLDLVDAGSAQTSVDFV